MRHPQPLGRLGRYFKIVEVKWRFMDGLVQHPLSLSRQGKYLFIALSLLEKGGCGVTASCRYITFLWNVRNACRISLR